MQSQARLLLPDLAPDPSEPFRAWMELQWERVHDKEFGHVFAQHCPVPGVGPEAYNHRVIEAAGNQLLAGIRFKGRRQTERFVEIVAWTRAPDWAVVAEAVRRDFASFSPSVLRVRWPGDAPPGPQSWEVDQWLLAERLGRLVGRVRPDGWDALDLRIAHDLSWYPMAEAAFAEWALEVGPRALEVEIAERGVLEDCLENGRVLCAWEDDVWRGVVAAAREAERAFHGYVVAEELLDRPFRGRRLGPVLQRGLIEALPDAGNDVLWGTIHGTNTPSLRTALAVGRRIVETWWFLPL